MVDVTGPNPPAAALRATRRCGQREPVRRVVLDTNYFRGASVRMLAALVERGFRISVSVNAFTEHWLRTYVDENFGLLAGRAKNIRPFVDRELPILPTGIQLVALIGGLVRDGSAPRLEQFLAWTNDAWHELSSGNVPKEWWTRGALASLATIGEHESVFDGLVRLTPEVFPAILALPEEKASLRLGATFREHASMIEQCPYGVQSRKHAFYAAAAFHIVRAHHHPGSCSSDPNLAEDVDLLQHLATPAILLTRDFPLIALVDACGTCQAPWVRTIGELLMDGPPVGFPWGKNAKRVKRGFSRRPKKALAQLEDQVVASLSKSEPR